jgi:enolase
MSKIKDIQARRILDSRGYPTIEVTITTTTSSGTSSVPSGASTGIHEALELRDNTKSFHGKDVQKAIHNIHKIIKPKLLNQDITNQTHIDQLMLNLDGTENKSKLGANATLAVSLACARAAANSKHQPLYIYLHQLITQKINITTPFELPHPFMNIINGGKHAGTKLAIQEFMIVPNGKTFSESIQIGSEVYHTLQQLLKQQYGPSAINIGDEGGFAPQLNTAEQALDLLIKAIKHAGYEKKVFLAIDCAASEFYHKKTNRYNLNNKSLSSEQLLNYYLRLIKKYPQLISIEDPFHQDDFSSFAKLNQSAKHIQIIGDDLTVTNQHRIHQAIEHNSCSCLLLKLNQIGTLTESLHAAATALNAKWKVMVSHRSGETTDSFIADLTIALGCGQIKAGAPCRGERVAKYNRLLEIERELEKTKNSHHPNVTKIAKSL